jgi:hypothetical protein
MASVFRNPGIAGLRFGASDLPFRSETVRNSIAGCPPPVPAVSERGSLPAPESSGAPGSINGVKSGVISFKS